MKKARALPASRSSTRLSSRAAIGLLAAAALVWGALLIRQHYASPARRHIDAGIDYANKRLGLLAEREWREAIRLDPKSAQAWELLGDLYLSVGEADKALEAFQQVERLAPTTARLHERLAVSAFRAGEDKTAYRYAQKALESDPNNTEALGICAEVLVDAGEDQRRIDYLRRLVQQKPDDLHWLDLLARALTARHQYAEARAVLEQILRRNPNHFEAYSMRGRGWFNEDRSPEGMARAEADFKRAIELEPRAPFPHLYLGKIYRQRGQLPAALAELETAARLGPERPDIFMELARAYQQAGQPEKAAQARKRFQTLREEADLAGTLEKRCHAYPDNFDYQLQLGLLSLKMRDLGRAEYYLNRALALRPGDARTEAGLQKLAAMKQEPGSHEGRR